MSDLFANPLEEMIEFQDLKTDLQRGQGPLLVTMPGFAEGASAVRAFGSDALEADCHLR